MNPNIEPNPGKDPSQISMEDLGCPAHSCPSSRVVQTVEWKQFIEDLSNIGSVEDKLLMLLRSLKNESYGRFTQYFPEMILTSYDEICFSPELSAEIEEKLESLDTPEALDKFLADLWVKIGIDITTAEGRNFIAHEASKMLQHPIQQAFLNKWPRDSSKLEMWYTLAKHFKTSADIMYDIIEVYKQNQDDERSKKFVVENPEIAHHLR